MTNRKPTARVRRLYFEQMENREMLSDVPLLTIEPAVLEASANSSLVTIPFTTGQLDRAHNLKWDVDIVTWNTAWQQLENNLRFEFAPDNWVLLGSASDAIFLTAPAPTPTPISVTPPSNPGFVDVAIAVNSPSQRVIGTPLSFPGSSPTTLASTNTPVNATRRGTSALTDESPRERLRRRPAELTGNRHDAQAFELGFLEEDRLLDGNDESDSLQLPKRVLRRPNPAPEERAPAGKVNPPLVAGVNPAPRFAIPQRPVLEVRRDRIEPTRELPIPKVTVENRPAAAEPRADAKSIALPDVDPRVGKTVQPGTPGVLLATRGVEAAK